MRSTIRTGRQHLPNPTVKQDFPGSSRNASATPSSYRYRFDSTSGVWMAALITFENPSCRTIGRPHPVHLILPLTSHFRPAVSSRCIVHFLNRLPRIPPARDAWSIAVSCPIVAAPGKCALQQRLYFRPEPQGQGSFRPTFRPNTGGPSWTDRAWNPAAPLPLFRTCRDLVQPLRLRTNSGIIPGASRSSSSSAVVRPKFDPSESNDINGFARRSASNPCAERQFGPEPRIRTASDPGPGRTASEPRRPHRGDLEQATPPRRLQEPVVSGHVPRIPVTPNRATPALLEQRGSVPLRTL